MGLKSGSSLTTCLRIPFWMLDCAGHSGDVVLGKGWMVGSLCPGIWGSGWNGRVEACSGPAAGLSGKDGRVMGLSIGGRT